MVHTNHTALRSSENVGKWSETLKGYSPKRVALCNCYLKIKYFSILDQHVHDYVLSVTRKHGKSNQLHRFPIEHAECLQAK